MKTYKLLTAIAFLSLGLTACDKELKEDTELHVGVATSQDVNFDGKTVTVKKGTPVVFTLDGDPDFITFFSGESLKEYKYKDRTMMQLEDLDVCELSLGISAMAGNINNADITLYVSDKFPGLAKNNFEADRRLLDEEFNDWNILIDKNDKEEGAYPSKVWSNESDALKTENVKWVTRNLQDYLGKKVTFAICYRGVNNTSAQPKFYFLKLQMKKAFKNGIGTTTVAKDFGFTPVNMLCNENLDDQTAAVYKPNANNKEYGYVTNNIPGIWKMGDLNQIAIHSSAKDKALKYSWLVSDPISIDASCNPDTGTSIKNISQSLSSYTYTYEETGTYTATFVANNANYVYEGGQVVRELTINVVE